MSANAYTIVKTSLKGPNHSPSPVPWVASGHLTSYVTSYLQLSAQEDNTNILYKKTVI